MNNDPPSMPSPQGDEASSSAVGEAVGQTLGRYKLRERIGEGGYGMVYVAEQEEPIRRRVALKVIKLGMDTRSVIARFDAERQALARMDHPNIAKVLDAGSTDSGRPYFVMELVRGIRITDYCDQNNLSTRQRLELFIPVCHAIQHAHQKGIIHRDLKPSNILVTLHDGVPVPKVIDFGIAKATEGRLTDATVYTQMNQFIGTPAYMSPEQAEMSGLDVDTRADLYSLGVVLYELLTGRTPFEGKELAAAGIDAMRWRIRETEPPRPSTRLASLKEHDLAWAAKHRSAEPPKLISLLKGDLDWIVMKCLEKDRTRRYETANGLALDIERHLNNEPVVARPPTAAYKVQKFVRRNKVMVGAAGLVAGALLLGILVSTWQAVQATRARQEQTRQRQVAEQARADAERTREIAETNRQRAEAYLYDADMNLAGQALRQNDLGRALSFLNLHRPANSGKRDLRGWEWRYLWGQCRSDEEATIGWHSNTVQSVAVSPDGKWIASGGWDGLLKIWELTPGAAGGRCSTNQQLGGSPVCGVAFSPDGHWLAARTWTNGFALLQVPSWRREMAYTDTARTTVGAVAFSGNNRLLAVAGEERSEVWSLDTRTRLCTLPCKTFDWGDPGVAWLPNSQTLAGFVGSNSSWQVQLFDIRANVAAPVSSIPLQAEMGRIAPYPGTLVFSPEGKYLAIGCWDNLIRIHAATNWYRVQLLTNHTAWVSSLAFSKDGQWLASASADQSIKLWRTRDWLEMTTLRGHLYTLMTVAFTPDGHQLVTGSQDHSVRLWPVSPQARTLDEVLAPSDDEHIVRLSGGRPYLFGPSNVLIVWDGETLQVRQRITRFPVTNVNNSVPSPDGRFLLMGTLEGGLWLSDLALAAGLPPVCLRTNGSSMERAVFSDQVKWLAVVASDTLQVWDLKHQPPQAGLVSARGHFHGLRFSQDERLLGVVTGPISTDRTVRVWEVASGKELDTFQPHRDEVTGLDFSPDGTVLATASWDNTCKLFDLHRREEIATFRGHLLAFHSVRFSSDGRRLAAGMGGGGVVIWDLGTRREVLTLKRQQGLANTVYGLRFEPSGDSLLTVDGGGVLSLWRAPTWAEIQAAEKDRPQEP